MTTEGLFITVIDDYVGGTVGLLTDEFDASLDLTLSVVGLIIIFIVIVLLIVLLLFLLIFSILLRNMSLWSNLNLPTDDLLG